MGGMGGKGGKRHHSSGALSDSLNSSSDFEEVKKGMDGVVGGGFGGGRRIGVGVKEADVGSFLGNGGNPARNIRTAPGGGSEMVGILLAGGSFTPTAPSSHPSHHPPTEPRPDPVNYTSNHNDLATPSDSDSDEGGIFTDNNNGEEDILLTSFGDEELLEIEEDNLLETNLGTDFLGLFAPSPTPGGGQGGGKSDWM